MTIARHQVILHERYLLCFKKVVQIDIRRQTGETPLKSIEKALVLLMIRDQAFAIRTAQNPLKSLAIGSVMTMTIARPHVILHETLPFLL